MRTRPCSSGPFPFRLWFDELEFEEKAEAVLRRHGLLPEEPGPVNIELLVDLEFGFGYKFEDLPQGELGKISFGEKGPVELVINSKLDAYYWPEKNRVCRATLAHEIGHGLLHSELFAMRWQKFLKGSCFSLNEQSSSLRAGSGDSRWWEYQANRIMAALLVPRDLLRLAVSRTALADKPPHLWNKGDLIVLVEHISDSFHVGRTLAERRLKRIYGLEPSSPPIPRVNCQPRKPNSSRPRPRRRKRRFYK